MSCTHYALVMSRNKEIEIIITDGSDRFGDWVGFSRLVLIMSYDGCIMLSYFLIIGLVIMDE